MAKDDLVLGIDQSTQGTKALLFDGEGRMLDIETLPHRQIINDLGYVEHDLNEIGKNVIAVVKALLDKDSNRKNKVKIPDACIANGVQYCNTIEMLRQLGERF